MATSPSELPNAAIGAAADESVDAYWLAVVVVDEVHLGFAHQNWLAILNFKLGHDAAAHDLLGWNSITLFAEGTNILDSTAEDDECFEATRAKERQQLQHRLIDKVGIRFVESRMAGGRQPVLNDTLERFRRHAGVSSHYELNESGLTSGSEGFRVVLNRSLKWLLVFPLRMLRGQFANTVENEYPLKIEWLFGPERAVVVECCDSFWHRNRIRTSWSRYAPDEIDD